MLVKSFTPNCILINHVIPKDSRVTHLHGHLFWHKRTLSVKRQKRTIHLSPRMAATNPYSCFFTAFQSDSERSSDLSCVVAAVHLAQRLSSSEVLGCFFCFWNIEMNMMEKGRGKLTEIKTKRHWEKKIK